MKRVLAIVGVVLSVAVVVGAFIVTGGDGSSEAKQPTSTEASNVAKDAVQAIANAGVQVQSEAPTKGGNESDDDKKDDDKDDSKYEVKAAFIGVSPSKLQSGKDLEIEGKYFVPGDNVKIVIFIAGKDPIVDTTVKADKQGRIKLKVKKLTAPEGTYAVTATGLASGSFDSTTLVIVKKK